METPLVHKRVGSEVLLSRYELPRPGAVIALTSWPTTHSHYRLGGRLPDVLLVAETFRQASILLGHSQFDVPVGWPFVMDNIVLSVGPDHIVQTPGAAVTAHLAAADVVRKGGRLYCLGVEACFFAGFEQFASGSGRLRVMDPRVYTRLRGAAAGASNLSLPRRSDGAEPFALRPVACGTARHEWELEIDPHNPFYFDHPVDHVPGMLLIAALRDVAVRFAGDRATCLVGFEAEFTRYLEFDELSRVRAEAVDDGVAPGSVRLRMTVAGADGDVAVVATADVAPAEATSDIDPG